MIREAFVVGPDTYTVFISDVDPVYETCEVKIRKNKVLLHQGTCTNTSEIPVPPREIAKEILDLVVQAP
jgi:hypothetical protein